MTLLLEKVGGLWGFLVIVVPYNECVLGLLFFFFFFQNQDPVAVYCLAKGIRGSVGIEDKEVNNVAIFLFLIEMKPRKAHRK